MLLRTAQRLKNEYVAVFNSPNIAIELSLSPTFFHAEDVSLAITKLEPLYPDSNIVQDGHSIIIS
jgi:hypothetical protein